MFARQVKDAVCLWDRKLVCCSVDTGTRNRAACVLECLEKISYLSWFRNLSKPKWSQLDDHLVIESTWNLFSPPRRHRSTPSLWNRVFETHNPKTQLQIKRMVTFGKLLLHFGVSNINDDQSICQGLWVFLQSFQQQKKAVLIFPSLW